MQSQNLPVRMISIELNGELHSVYLDVQREFKSKQEGIDWLNNDVRFRPGLSSQQNKDLHELGYTRIGRTIYFLLYRDEQRKWIKNLVRDLV